MIYQVRCIKEVIVEVQADSRDQAIAQALTMDLDSMPIEWLVQEPVAQEPQTAPAPMHDTRPGFLDDEHENPFG